MPPIRPTNEPAVAAPTPAANGKTTNREQWLTDLARQIQPTFVGFSIARYRITCGWPVRNPLGTRRRTIGECHSGKTSKAGVFELFISPTLDEPLQVAGVVCHELAHVAAGTEAGHKGMFLKVCRQVGLTNGKPTEIMPGDKLNETLKRMIERQGPYPHDAIVGTLRKVRLSSPQMTLTCECGCKVRIETRWYEEAGPPRCGCGGSLLPKDEGESEE